jgi:glucose/mannose-6-phosphate isomerase
MTDASLLDNKKIIKDLDKSNCLESITLLSKQCDFAWEEVKKMNFPSEYRNVSSIVFTGMGGSAYGARIIKSLFSDSIKIPVDIVNDYHLPGFAGSDTLVVAASYSGGTEETLSCAKEALERGCKTIGISSGGNLEEMLKKAGNPVFVFDTEYNPSNQPRLGQGYMQMGQLAMLNKLGFLNIKEEEIKEVISLLISGNNEFNADILYEKNIAKKNAYIFKDKIVNLIAAEFLEGAVHSIRNPLHETGKHFANYFLVPEMNHHLMEGLSFPSNNPEILHFVLINSFLYREKIQKRMKLTKEVIIKNNIGVTEVALSGKTRLEQVFELIQLGSFISFYLAMIHGVNPANIPWVDYFKNNLKKL